MQNTTEPTETAWPQLDAMIARTHRLATTRDLESDPDAALSLELAAYRLHEARECLQAAHG